MKTMNTNVISNKLNTSSVPPEKYFFSSNLPDNNFGSQLSLEYNYNSSRNKEIQKILNSRFLTKSINNDDSNAVSRHTNSGMKSVNFDEILFDARAKVKVIFSKVSMHFSPELRQKLFRQIDMLHEPDDWEEGDLPIEEHSFMTFIRWFFLYKPTRLPSFGLSSSGNFIASWLKNERKDSLILEFMSNDRIKWFITERFESEIDRITGMTNLERISGILQGCHSERWLDGKGS